MMELYLANCIASLMLRNFLVTIILRSTISPSAWLCRPQNQIHSGQNNELCLFSLIALASAELIHTSTLCCGFSTDWMNVLNLPLH